MIKDLTGYTWQTTPSAEWDSLVLSRTNVFLGIVDYFSLLKSSMTGTALSRTNVFLGKVDYFSLLISTMTGTVSPHLP